VQGGIVAPLLVQKNNKTKLAYLPVGMLAFFIPSKNRCGRYAALTLIAWLLRTYKKNKTENIMLNLKRAGRALLAGAVASILLTPMAMAATINIGFTGPLSGGAALYGKDSLDGMKMAADEINSNGGVEVDGTQYKVKIVSYDDQYAPSKAAINAKRLVQANKASVIFTPHSGGIFALQAFNENSNFLLMANSSLPEISNKGNELTVRMPPLFTDYMDPFITHAMGTFGKRVAIANANHDYAKVWTKEFVPAWEAAGGEVVANSPMDYNKSADFYTGVSRALQAKPDVLFVGGASEPTGLVMKQAIQLGFKGGFILMDQAKLAEVADIVGGMDQIEGAIGLPPLEAYGIDAAQRLVNRYKEEKKDRDPTTEVGTHYFSVHLVVEAMKQAGTVEDGRAIRAAMNDALGTLPAKYNVYAIQKIDQQGGFAGNTYYAVVKDGQLDVRQEASGSR